MSTDHTADDVTRLLDKAGGGDRAAAEALLPMVTQKLRDAGADIPVILGGIVPEGDFQSMYDAGIARVLTPGATAEEVVEAVRGAIAETRGE